MNIFKKFRTNWKKSIFSIGVCIYGVRYVKGNFEEWKLMKKYCLEAKKHGQMPIGSTSQPKKVAVILNPASNRGKGRDLYKKKVAPLLHLAAFDVELLLSQHEGHAKMIISELGQTNAILIAAGDGMVSEVVTGLMKRPDEQFFSQIPFCVVPLGKTNTLAKLLHPATHQNSTRFIGEMLMSLVNNTALKYVDVFGVQAGKDKKVFGVGNLSIGAFTDSNIKRSSWFSRLFGGKVGYWITSIFGWQDLSKDTSLTFSRSCSGCNRCVRKASEAPKRWWQGIVTTTRDSAPQKDYSLVVNEDCSKTHQVSRDLSQLDLVTNVHTNSIIARFTQGNLNRQQFIQLGHERSTKASDLVHEDSVGSFSLHHLDEERKLQIDNETYDGMKSLEVTLLPNKLKFFFNPKHCVLEG